MQLSWRSILEVGVAEIDDGHRRLVELLSRIDEASVDEDRQAALDLLYRLRCSVAGHCAHAEQLMADLPDAGAAAHRREHGKLTDELPRKVGELEQGRIVAGGVSVFVQRWLSRHIASADRELGEAIVAQRAARAPKSFGSGCLPAGRSGHGPLAEAAAVAP